MYLGRPDLPVGGDLEYVDPVTLTRALPGRSEARRATARDDGRQPGAGGIVAMVEGRLLLRRLRQSGGWP